MTAKQNNPDGTTSQEQRQAIGTWLSRLALLVAPSLSPDEVKLRIGALVIVLEGQYDPRVWGAEVLRDCAARFKFFPSFQELKPVLDMWGSVYRVRDNPAITRRVMAHIASLQQPHSNEPAPLAIAIGKHLRVN